MLKVMLVEDSVESGVLYGNERQDIENYVFLVVDGEGELHLVNAVNKDNLFITRIPNETCHNHWPKKDGLENFTVYVELI